MKKYWQKPLITQNYRSDFMFLFQLGASTEDISIKWWQFQLSNTPIPTSIIRVTIVYIKLCFKCLHSLANGATRCRGGNSKLKTLSWLAAHLSMVGFRPLQVGFAPLHLSSNANASMGSCCVSLVHFSRLCCHLPQISLSIPAFVVPFHSNSIIRDPSLKVPIPTSRG